MGRRWSSVLVGALAVVLLGDLTATARVAAKPPKTFDLWTGNWTSPYGTLTLKAASVKVGTGPSRPGVSGTFSKGGSLVAALSAPGDTPGNLGLWDPAIFGTYTIPNLGKGSFHAQTDWGERRASAYRTLHVRGDSGSPLSFDARYTGGGPDHSELTRSFKAFGPWPAGRQQGVEHYRVRWVYDATLIGPTALPYPGLELKLRFSRPVKPGWFATTTPNLSQDAPGNLQTTCLPKETGGRKTSTGFDCETYSLGPRGSYGWIVRLTVEAVLPKGSGPISATITNAISDTFSSLPTTAVPPLTAGRGIPGGGTLPGSGTPATVSGRADVFAAGLSSPPAFPGGGGVLPVAINVRPGTRIQIASAKGAITCCGPSSTASPPDGLGGKTDITSAGGISGIVAGRVMFLAGVFTGNSLSATAPSRLSFPPDVKATSLSPQLQQTFYVGDGRTPSGRVQTFLAPPGATRLYLGIADAYAFAGVPGYYDDNTGSFRVRVRSF